MCTIHTEGDHSRKSLYFHEIMVAVTAKIAFKCMWLPIKTLQWKSLAINCSRLYSDLEQGILKILDPMISLDNPNHTKHSKPVKSGSIPPVKNIRVQYNY